MRSAPTAASMRLFPVLLMPTRRNKQIHQAVNNPHIATLDILFEGRGDELVEAFTMREVAELLKTAGVDRPGKSPPPADRRQIFWTAAANVLAHSPPWRTRLVQASSSSLRAIKMRTPSMVIRMRKA